jgi:hypothetical protein
MPGASHAIILRRTVIGSGALLVLAISFAQQGGPAEMAAAELAKVAKAPAPLASDEPAAAPSAPPSPRPTPASWFEPDPDETPTPPPPSPSAGSGSEVRLAEQFAANDHPVMVKSPPRGVDFPENN